MDSRAESGSGVVGSKATADEAEARGVEGEKEVVAAVGVTSWSSELLSKPRVDAGGETRRMLGGSRFFVVNDVGESWRGKASGVASSKLEAE